MDRGGLSLVWALLCTLVPRRLALPHGAQEVLEIGTEHHRTENYSTGRKVTYMCTACYMHAALC